MSYIVQHGPQAAPSDTVAQTLGAATRLALAFVREQRKNVRVRLPDGRTMDFEAFQDAVFAGALRDD